MAKEIIVKAVKELLGKYGDSIAASLKQITFKGWEKFKLDFDLSYKKYLDDAYEKYSHIKTILYKSEPQPLYDFFEVPYLQMENTEAFKANTIDDVVNKLSNFILIKGTGGIGKSTLLKHLFLSAIKSDIFIPVFIELKDLNLMEEPYELAEYLFGRLKNLNSKSMKEYFDVALQSGRFVFLFDGYDEMLTEKRSQFTKKLEDFIDRYSENVFILTSRPFSDFIFLQRFSVLDALPFEKEQAVSMIKKLHYDPDIKAKFIQRLEDGLFEKHGSFASNPLLLTIMLITYDDYAEIPEKLHNFYANAFETLYSKHDATKSGYIRPKKSNLSKEDFKMVFGQFCFFTYWNNQLEFSRDAFAETLKKISKQRGQFDIDDYIDDLENALCLVYVDGLNYRFSHRSFQEYFTAYFFRKLPDETMEQLALMLIKQDAIRAAHDNVFPMLYDMEEDRVEQKILLPLLKELDKSSQGGQRFDYYFQSFVPSIAFRDVSFIDGKEEIRLTRSLDYSKKNGLPIMIDTLFRIYSRKNRDSSFAKETVASENELLEYLEEKEYHLDDVISNRTIMRDDKLYSLVKETWIGDWIRQLIDLKTTLTEKKSKTNQDILAMLNNL